MGQCILLTSIRSKQGSLLPTSCYLLPTFCLLQAYLRSTSCPTSCLSQAYLLPTAYLLSTSGLSQVYLLPNLLATSGLPLAYKTYKRAQLPVPVTSSQELLEATAHQPPPAPTNSSTVHQSVLLNSQWRQLTCPTCLTCGALPALPGPLPGAGYKFSTALSISQSTPRQQGSNTWCQALPPPLYHCRGGGRAHHHHSTFTSTFLSHLQ